MAEFGTIEVWGIELRGGPPVAEIKQYDGALQQRQTMTKAIGEHDRFYTMMTRFLRIPVGEYLVRAIGQEEWVRVFANDVTVVDFRPPSFRERSHT